MAVSVVDANPTRPDEKIPPLHRDMPPLPRLKGKIMIEKIEMPEMDETYKSAMFAKVLGNKINELCDVVNEQQKQIDKMSCAILDLATPNGENKALESIKAESKTPVAPYAEQRNYDVYVKNRHLIGKLCKFKCGQGCYYGILTNIKRKPHEIPFESNGRAFRTCEPVKPTDSIIYKGNDNEK